MKKGEEGFTGHLVEDFRLVTTIPWALKRVNTDLISNIVFHLAKSKGSFGGGF